jgi:hypothetical protein
MDLYMTGFSYIRHMLASVFMSQNSNMNILVNGQGVIVS